MKRLFLALVVAAAASPALAADRIPAAFHGDGLGLYGAYPYYYDDYYPYYANDDYYEDGCYVVKRRVHTRYGWRVRPVQVCV